MDFPVFLTILISSIMATAVMTAFSYMVSERFNKLFKEPVLLSYAIGRFHLNLSQISDRILAWTLHFAIGFMFVVAYHFIWKWDWLPFTLQTALILGALSGVVGIISWHFIFKFTNHQPRIPFKTYYLQLFIAHVFFGVTAYYSYLLLGNDFLG